MLRKTMAMMSACALAGLLTGGVDAAATQKHAKGTAAAMDARTFVDHAAQDGLAEVALGKMAAEKAASADVKEFGQRMVDDHSKANDELGKLASSKGITAPTEVTNPKHKALMDRLEKLSGKEFDRAYIQAMVGDHEHAVGAFKSFAAHGQDAELKAWAEKTLPTLQEHERLAKTTAASVGVQAGHHHKQKHASAK